MDFVVDRSSSYNIAIHICVGSKGESDVNAQMDNMFKVLCTQETDTVRPRTLTHLGRDLTFKRTCGQVLDSTFEDLCDRVWTGDFVCFCVLLTIVLVMFQPLAGSDYLQIAQYFHTVLIRDVPQLNLDTKSQARRFITMIDTLYDAKVRVSKAIADR